MWCQNIHRGQTRRSGEDFSSHPIEVSIILMKLKQKSNMIIAALLHDSLEDTHIKLLDIEKKYGQEVALYVLAITNEEGVLKSDISKQKIVFFLKENPECLVMKLADRLHNMRTIRFLPQERQQKKAEETLSIYLPIARYLHLYDIAEELKQLSKRCLEECTA